MNNEEIQRLGKELVDTLSLRTSPVAVHLVQENEELPVGIPRIGENTRHCQMVDSEGEKDLSSMQSLKIICVRAELQ